MNQLERNKSILTKYIPEPAVETIAEWIYVYDFKLKVKKSRATKLGDYRAPHSGKNHEITINHDLNKYAFLITLVHEIAHLTNWNKHKDKVKPHGDEWKMHYKLLMGRFLVPEIFPDDIIYSLRKYMSNPAAASCSDINLLRVLKRYDANTDLMLLEDLPEGAKFSYNDTRHFVKGKQNRKRITCVEIHSKRVYLFNPIVEVKHLILHL